MREILIEDLPQECIEDCSASGAVDDAVAYWIEEPRVAAVFAQLKPRDLRECLRGYGAWDDDELADDDANRRRILWIACGNFRDFQVAPECGGSDVFVLE